MKLVRQFKRAAIAVVATGLLPWSAAAHPHVFVEAKVETVFDESGQLAAVRNIWQFDPGYSQFAVTGLDTNGDGAYDQEELADLADLNIESLADFSYFNHLTVDDELAAARMPDEYHLEYGDGLLTLFFTLPLETPRSVESRAFIEVFDPEYFVAFAFAAADAVSLVAAPAGCTASLHLPEELDEQTMMSLGQLPADSGALPPDLAEDVRRLANYVDVRC